MRPPKTFTEEHKARGATIGAAIKRVGLKTLAAIHGVTSWSIHKWRNGGYVPNRNLETYCKATGDSPWDVCDPDLAFMRHWRKKPKSNTTKSS